MHSSYETVQEHMASPEFQERLQRDNELTDRIKAGFIPAEPTEENPRPKVVDGTLNEDAADSLGQLYEAYERLNHKLAAKAYNRAGRPAALSQEDLEQEGFYGLFQAALAWKPERSRGGFTSYARQSMWRTMDKYVEDKSRNVRLPNPVRQNVNRYRIAFWGVYGNDEHLPRRQLLAKVLNMSIEEIDEIATAEALADQMGSIHGGYFEDDRDQHSTYTRNGEGRWKSIDSAASEMRSVEEEILMEEVSRIVNESITPGDETTMLSEREAAMLRLRFFGVAGQPQTLEEIAQQFGVTRERVRQIEAKTLAKLRHPHRRTKLEALIKN